MDACREGGKCVSCTLPIEQADSEYANDPAAHPGVLGPVHPSCYCTMADTAPDLPWTDPISGEVDYEEMAEDLGISTGAEGDFDEGDSF